MTIHDIRAYVESLPAVLTLAPASGDGTPELAWGDLFFYYAPDGRVPSTQPFATIVTKDYPGEPSSDLSGEAFRVNIDAGRRNQPPCADPTARDHVMPHPLYGHLGWVCVVAPGLSIRPELFAALTAAHTAARARWDRRRS
jgi:hypothetical protein